MNLENSLWVEKYRPQTLDEYIGNEDVKGKVKVWLEQGDIPSLLLYGSAGTGKTSLAKLIGKSLDADVLYINTSDENSVDVIRDKIKGFASTIGFSRWKIIILDECLKYDTLVHVLRNNELHLIPISELDDRYDLIKSFNLTKNEIEFCPFALKNTGTRQLYKITLENGEIIECTDNHKWYVFNDLEELIVVQTSDLGKYNHIVSPL